MIETVVLISRHDTVRQRPCLRLVEGRVRVDSSAGAVADLRQAIHFIIVVSDALMLAVQRLAVARLIIAVGDLLPEHVRRAQSNLKSSQGKLYYCCLSFAPC